MRLFSFIGPVLLAGKLCFCASGLSAQTASQTDGATQDITSIIQDAGIANRLTVGQVLLTHTQGIPAAACHLHNQVNVEVAASLLSEGVARVDELKNALLQGDASWGIETPEVRRKTIAEIAHLQAEWAPVQGAVGKLLADPADQAATRVVLDAAQGLHDLTSNLLTTLDGQYSSLAEISSRDVMYIQIAGRMTALNQQIALRACELWSGGMDATKADDLKRAITGFENSRLALTNGLEQMSIMPPPTPGIADKLAEIGGLWAQNRPLLDMVVADQEISDNQRFDLYDQMIDERDLLLDLVYLYQDHAKIAH